MPDSPRRSVFRIVAAALLFAQGAIVALGALALGGWAVVYGMSVRAGAVQPALGSDTPKAALGALLLAVPLTVVAGAALVAALTVAEHRWMRGRERLGGAALALVVVADGVLVVAAIPALLA